MSARPTEHAVPVSMGSPRFDLREVGGIRCTKAWFPPGAELEAHVHDRATFAVILAGSFDLSFTSGALRRRHLDCSAGTIFSEPAGEPHRNRIGTTGAEVMVLQIDPAGADVALEPFRPMLTDQIHHFRHGRIGLQARRMAREISHPDPLSDLAIESLALDMFVQAGRLRRDRSRDRPTWLGHAEEYVRAHFRESLKVSDVAGAVGIHPAHLASTFRRYHGVPLGEFIRRLRLEWAADRLARSDDSLSSIAYAAGFADQAHLTRAFKEHTGQPPGAYRRMCR